MKKFNPYTIECPPDIAAAHQAGVLLVAHVLGLKPRYAEIFADHGIVCLWSGTVLHEPLEAPGEELAPNQIIGKVMLLMAGWIGEQVIADNVRAVLSDDAWSEAIALVESIDGYEGYAWGLWRRAVVLCLWEIFQYLQDEGVELQKTLICKRRVEADVITTVLGEHQALGVEVVGRLVRLMAGGVQ